ncbi:MAG TPA: SEC-C domain-containing protein [Longimicrobium sp.]|jgi:hypothetical protein|uniref:YecA family protein n=1 Tax=Longimicrobium sp. TaxID=2029185 RepID=UPI002EDAD86E
MKTSRNDPCRCGSGKKYKACCMGRDQARERARSIIGEEVFDAAEAEWMAAARTETVWAADVVPAPGLVREAPDGLSLAMVMAGEWAVHTDVLSHRPAGAAERARDLAAVVNAGARALGVLPERVVVPYPDVVEELDRLLAGRGISVGYGDSEHLAEAMDSVLAQMDPSPAQGRLGIALTWRETGASAQELADFHQAAAAFYAAEPWNVDEVPESLLLEFAGKEYPWGASLMGGGGESFGLVLHSRPEDLRAIWMSDDPSSAFLEMTGFTLTVDFDRKSELTRGMQREVTAARWPIAGPHAYPRLFAMDLPGRWITAEEVRLATLALRAVTVHARGGDALAETGVRLSGFGMEDEESRLEWFRFPDAARPICAEGPGAEPGAGLRAWDTDEQGEQVQAVEEERLGQLSAWLAGRGRADVEVEADRQNARHWTDFLGRTLPAGAVTEYDLRLFLYSYYPQRSGATIGATRELPRSMRLIVQFLEEREGIRYPFAGAVLNELDEIEARAREEHEPLEDTLRFLSYEIYDYLDTRVLLPVMGEEWPVLTSLEIAQLQRELQRRWLLWFDELARDGETDHAVFESELESRQRQWENTPHPRVGGKTPKQVLMEMILHEEALAAGSGSGQT